MFTGLIEEVGKVSNIQNKGNHLFLEVSAKKILEDTKIGDSISVNGVCLTVVSMKGEKVSFDVSYETLNRSNLKFLKIGDFVNLERALKVSDRLGGHIVQGHVDTTGKISDITAMQEHTIFKIEIPYGNGKFTVEKGSIAIDGISLTINQIERNILSFNIIPHTIENTNLKHRKIGDIVNIEFDIVGKYIINAVEKYGVGTNSSLEELLKNF